MSQRMVLAAGGRSHLKRSASYSADQRLWLQFTRVSLGTRDEYGMVGNSGRLAPMSLVGMCALVVGFGSLVLVGIFALVRDLFSDSTLGVPSESDEKASHGHADQRSSASSSLTSIR